MPTESCFAALGIWLGLIKPTKNANKQHKIPVPATSHIPIFFPGTL